MPYKEEAVVSQHLHDRRRVAVLGCSYRVLLWDLGMYSRANPGNGRSCHDGVTDNPLMMLMGDCGTISTILRDLTVMLSYYID